MLEGSAPAASGTRGGDAAKPWRRPQAAWPARALLPNGALPAELLSAGVVGSVAGASCESGKLTLTGSSTITGVRLLGRPIDVDTPVQQSVDVLDTATIDPSNINIANVGATSGLGLTVPLGPALQAAIQPLLDGLATIVSPPAVAQVKISGAPPCVARRPACARRSAIPRRTRPSRCPGGSTSTGGRARSGAHPECS